MIRRPPRSTRTDTLFPYTTLFRSHGAGQIGNLRNVADRGWRKVLRAVRARIGSRDPSTCRDVRIASRLFFSEVAASLAINHRDRRIGVIARRLAPAALLECRSDDHTSELQSLMLISYSFFCFKKHI